MSGVEACLQNLYYRNCLVCGVEEHDSSEDILSSLSKHLIKIVITTSDFLDGWCKIREWY